MLQQDFATFQRDETLLTAAASTAVNLHPFIQWNFISSLFLIKDGLNPIRREHE